MQIIYTNAALTKKSFQDFFLNLEKTCNKKLKIIINDKLINTSTVSSGCVDYVIIKITTLPSRNHKLLESKDFQICFFNCFFVDIEKYISGSHFLFIYNYISMQNLKAFSVPGIKCEVDLNLDEKCMHKPSLINKYLKNVHYIMKNNRFYESSDSSESFTMLFKPNLKLMVEDNLALLKIMLQECYRNEKASIVVGFHCSDMIMAHYFNCLSREEEFVYHLAGKRLKNRKIYLGFRHNNFISTTNYEFCAWETYANKLREAKTIIEMFHRSSITPMRQNNKISYTEMDNVTINNDFFEFCDDDAKIIV